MLRDVAVLREAEGVDGDVHHARQHLKPQMRSPAPETRTIPKKEKKRITHSWGTNVAALAEANRRNGANMMPTPVYLELGVLGLRHPIVRVLPRPENERAIGVEVDPGPDRRVLVDEAGDRGGLGLGKGVRAAVGVAAR